MKKIESLSIRQGYYGYELWIKDKNSKNELILITINNIISQFGLSKHEFIELAHQYNGEDENYQDLSFKFKNFDDINNFKELLESMLLMEKIKNF
jgi:hypothetical protein